MSTPRMIESTPCFAKGKAGDKSIFHPSSKYLRACGIQGAVHTADGRGEVCWSESDLAE